MQGVPGCLEDAGLWARQAQGIPIDVNVVGITPCKLFCAIRVEHGDHVNSEVIKNGLPDAIKFIIGAQKIEQIHQSHRGGGFVSMHLRPHKYRVGTVSGADQVNGPTLDRCAKCFDRKFRMGCCFGDEGLNVPVLEPAIGNG